ncbi:MAG: SoxR reducing system RseC family protein [Clostridia bacterium]|nr:SoxR reducing system RseC family protein [Clostridia bacterium]
MIQKATVISTDGEIAKIEVIRATACEGCHRSQDGSGCAACTILDLKRKITADARNDIGALPGDEVVVETPSKTVLSISFLVFIIPLIIGIGSYFVFSVFISNDAILALISAAVIILVFAAIHFTVEKSRKGSAMLRIVSMYDNSSESELPSDADIRSGAEDGKD